MTSRERVLKALNFEQPDRVPIDLGAMLSTGISCFAYPDLVKALGLSPRRPRVHDTSQMLALPDLDVLDALGADIVSIYQYWNVTNGIEQPGRWKDYDFGGRLAACVLNPSAFERLPDGTVVQPQYKIKMPPQAHVFEAEHGGQPFSLDGDVPRPDLAKWRADLAASTLTDQQVKETAELCRRVREATDKAVFFNGPTAGIAITAHGGLGVFPLLCLMDPDFVQELHEITVTHYIGEMEKLLAEIRPYIDIMISGGDDWGSQSQPFAPPWVFEQLFLPYYQRVNARVHTVAPEIKTFLHSCGAIYDLIDPIVDAGFDILNPVQWTAGGKSWSEWKAKCAGRISLWGGGVDTQSTFPLGTQAEVENQVRQIVRDMGQGGGYVFNPIHNILAEIPGERVVAAYRTATTTTLERR